jgi:cation:H+ antiporter
MFFDIVLTLSGFVLLVWGADRFVAGAGSLARNLGVAPVLIGLTIVGFATSAPEIMVSASAAFQGLTSMAIGNAIGSNIANIALVLGFTALLRPIRGDVTPALRQQINAVIFVTALGAFLFFDDQLSRADGIILLAGMVAFLSWITWQGKRDSSFAEDVEEIANLNMRQSLTGIALGFGVLLLGANLLVTGAENLARDFGVSELVIGLTVVAIGTSLPELAVSIISVAKNEPGIAVGNIIGSNIFNLLAVVGVAGTIQPSWLPPSVLQFHYPVMAILTLALLRIAHPFLGKPGFGRIMGLLLLSVFIGYQAVVIIGNV